MEHEPTYVSAAPAARTEGSGGQSGHRLPGHRRLLGVLAGAIVVVGSLVSVVGGMRWNGYVRAQSTRAFTSMAMGGASALGIELQRDVDLTATAATLVETTPRLTNRQFATWFRLLGTRDSYPGSFGLIYLAQVSGAGLGAFSREVATDPPLGLPLPGPFTLSPAGAAPPYCLARVGVVRVTPAVGIPVAALPGLLTFTEPDLDYCALPVGSLLEESARSGSTSAVTLGELLAESPREAGVPRVPAGLTASLERSGLVATLTPVYAGGTIPLTATARATRLLGWIFGVYQAEALLDPLVQAHPDASATLRFTNPSGHRTILARAGTSPRGSLARTFGLAIGRQWSVRIAAPLSSSGLSADTQGLAVMAGGLMLSFLLGLLIALLSRSRARALRLVDERTSQLRHQALHDRLTGLANRTLILERIEDLLGDARREGGGPALLFVDLDHFKDINDTLGHDAGDDLLRQVSGRFSAVLQAFAPGVKATVGRMGGDEFVVIVEEPQGPATAEQVARELLDALGAPFQLLGDEGHWRPMGATIGIAIGPRASAGELLRDADVALYEAKAAARGGYVLFAPSMQAVLSSRLRLEIELREALSNHELFVVYQPTFDLASGAMIGAEALLRWRHPTRGIVLPAELIPTLEATGMILEVGRFVLDQACGQAAEWARRGHRLTVAVNVSGRQLDREDLPAVVEGALARAGLSPGLLTIEITETTLMRDALLSARRLSALKEIGVKVAIDDFGTGYCSLAYLQQFPVDTLKIDQSFVSRLESSTEGAALVRTILQMGRDLNLETLAEGIETPGQLARLRSESCTNGQGYLLAHPLSAAAMDALIGQVRPGPARTTVQVAGGDQRSTAVGTVS